MENAEQSSVNVLTNGANCSGELAQITAGIASNRGKLIEHLNQRVGVGDWRLEATNYDLGPEVGSVDLVFSAPDGRKSKYLLADIAAPHLGIGQKYLLPAKAKAFQAIREVSSAKIKKAIILVKKSESAVNTVPSRIRCPIIELFYDSIVKPKPEKPQASSAAYAKAEESSSPEQHKPKQTVSKPQPTEARMNEELLSSLKEAIVHECLSTMYKRTNKYIVKGLWRWIEREIMDSSVHFYLIMLSTIYQGKTGDLLSRTFKTPEVYSSNPDEIISVIFSKDNALADEIKKQAERHQKALRKFLACFRQTTPYEYLKSIFLKEFRTHSDSLKARMAVYSVLLQLLERCGFEGEKEVRYPLEILDELKIFQTIMAGDYTVLRTVNASKKLKHLVPELDWSDEEIYKLRDQLAKSLNIPAQEFNLNAFLPQAFHNDARRMAENHKEAISAGSAGFISNAKPIAEAIREARKERQTLPLQQANAANDKTNAQQPMQQPQQPMPVRQSPKAAKEAEVSQPAPKAAEQQHDLKLFTAQQDKYDESKHRFFESFGGTPEEDQDAVKLALAMVKHDAEKQKKAPQQDLQGANEAEEENEIIPRKIPAGLYHANLDIMPLKRPKTVKSPDSARYSIGSPERKGPPMHRRGPSPRPDRRGTDPRRRYTKGSSRPRRNTPNRIQRGQ